MWGSNRPALGLISSPGSSSAILTICENSICLSWRWISTKSDVSMLMNDGKMQMLKTKSCHNVNFVVTCGIAECHNHSLCRWRQSWGHDNPIFGEYILIVYPINTARKRIITVMSTTIFQGTINQSAPYIITSALCSFTIPMLLLVPETRGRNLQDTYGDEEKAKDSSSEEELKPLPQV